MKTGNFEAKRAHKLKNKTQIKDRRTINLQKNENKNNSNICVVSCGNVSIKKLKKKIIMFKLVYLILHEPGMN